MYLIGYDIGSSSIKVALVDTESGETISVVQAPKTEMDIIAKQPGWAEQEPSVWWEHLCTATKKLLASTNIDPELIRGVGIAYQMHGLVVVDKKQQVLRPAIIWCDSRAVSIGDQAFEDLGETTCLNNFLNSPGNFTASKLKWVKENEPDIYAQIDKMMLPGDYIGMKLTGQICTTPSGLSEGILWDFQKGNTATDLLNYYGIKEELIPTVVPTCSNQGTLTTEAAKMTGLPAGIPITYRAGDQPNNALSLNVLEPGEIAATGGTSGVVYGVIDKAVYDKASRVNSFAHVNYTENQQKIGVLLCINGAGIQYSWMKQQIANDNISYPDMEQMASSVPIGSEGLRILPFGNGAERMLGNENMGAQINNLQFNRHKQAHMYRAALEGIAFSFVYGMELLKDMGFNIEVMRVGNDNLFQSKVFAATIANLVGCKITVVETTGASGAAKAAGLETGFYKTLKEAIGHNGEVMTYHPEKNEAYEKAYQIWKSDLKYLMDKEKNDKSI